MMMKKKEEELRKRKWKMRNTKRSLSPNDDHSWYIQNIVKRK